MQHQHPPSVPQQPPITKPMEPTVQQYGQGFGVAGLMHGRYYESSTTEQSSESQSSPTERAPHTPMENNTASNLQQSHQQMLAAEPMVAQAPAPTPVSAQPEIPTPMTGNSVIDAASAGPTAEESTTEEEGTAPLGSAHGRVALLNSVLSCNLPVFLVDQVLENPTLPKIKDPTGAKVHAVGLLKLLASDPAQGAKISLMLDNLEAWKKYKMQDHSLFITGAEQKVDYFLLDQGGSSTKLLTDGESRTDDKGQKGKENGDDGAEAENNDSGKAADEAQGEEDEGDATENSNGEDAGTD